MTVSNVEVLQDCVSAFHGTIWGAETALDTLVEAARKVSKDPKSTTADHVRANFIITQAPAVRAALNNVHPGTLTPQVVESTPEVRFEYDGTPPKEIEVNGAVVSTSNGYEIGDHVELVKVDSRDIEHGLSVGLTGVIHHIDTRGKLMLKFDRAHILRYGRLRYVGAEKLLNTAFKRKEKMQ